MLSRSLTLTDLCIKVGTVPVEELKELGEQGKAGMAQLHHTSHISIQILYSSQGVSTQINPN